MNESEVPPRTVLCTPSKALEAWVVVALFPDEPVVRAGKVECRAFPENLLSAKPMAERLVRRGEKDVEMYEDRAQEFADAWTRVRAVCSEAERFSHDFLAIVPSERPHGAF